MSRVEKVMSEVNHLFDPIEKVLRQTTYDHPIHRGDGRVATAQL